MVVVGELPYAEGQGDVVDLVLDPGDVEVIEQVCYVMACVVVLVSGRPMIVTDVLPQVDALVAAWLLGTEGQGVADVLFGDHDFDWHAADVLAT